MELASKWGGASASPEPPWLRACVYIFTLLRAVASAAGPIGTVATGPLSVQQTFWSYVGKCSVFLAREERLPVLFLSIRTFNTVSMQEAIYSYMTRQLAQICASKEFSSLGLCIRQCEHAYGMQNCLAHLAEI